MQCWISLCLSYTRVFTFIIPKRVLTVAAHKDLCPIATQHFLSPMSKEENRSQYVAVYIRNE
uniref:Uncharacterized protein n=1 Tax=Glossina palpalis gambiensis TaxID=67801 RepID=A0A1B0B0Z2_9MUSC